MSTLAINTRNQHSGGYMTTKEAITFFGSVGELARALNIWPHNVSRWGERPPMARQYEIEVKTGGVLRADNDNA